MGEIHQPIGVLTGDEMERIHQGALRLLGTTGMWIDHDEALDLLGEADCRVDRHRRRVWFPPEVVQASVDRMRAAYADPDRVPERMAVRYSQVRFRSEPVRVHPDFTVSTGGFCPFIHDLSGRRRNATLDDVREAIRLADALDEITFMGLPCSAQDVAPALRPVAMAAELAKRTTKLGGIETFSAFDVAYVTRIAEVVAGGAQALRRRPVLVGYSEVRSPLCLDANMADVLIAYVRNGLPQTVDTMPCGGTTAPITAAGILAQGCAETLGGLVLAHAVDPDAVVGVDMCPSYADMRTCLYGYAKPERWPLMVGRIQMISTYYGCPSGVHGGKTDSCYPDVRAGIEKALSMIYPALAGAIGIGTVGHLENAVTFSPVQLVIDCACAGYVRRMLRGIAVNDRTLALDVIASVGPGGHYLGEAHTLEHMREEVSASEVFVTQPWEVAHAADATDMVGWATRRAQELSGQDRPSPLSADQTSTIDAIVAEARARLRQSGRL